MATIRLGTLPHGPRLKSRALKAPAQNGVAQRAATPLARFEPAQHINTSAREASDVVALPDGRLLVVSDKSDKIYLVDSRGRETTLDLPKLRNGKSQLEGVAFDPVRNHLFVAREEKGVILRYEWNPAKNKPPKLEKRFEVDFKTGDWGNKGIEGLTFLPAKLSPTGEAQLLAAKEGKPRRLYLFDASGGGKPREIKVDDAVRDVAKDFSALAMDPKTGHLYISSDESALVAQLKWVRDGDNIRAELVQAIPIRSKDGKKLPRIEGLTFNTKGDLYVLTENNGVLHELKRLGN